MSSTPTSSLLQAARERYALSHPKSKAAFEHATTYLPGGGTRSSIAVDPFPLFLERGEEDVVRDLDGNEYLDLIADFTSGLYGKTHPVLRSAILSALDDGLQLGMHTPSEATLAQLLVERFPSVEQVRFANSGTEANMLAIACAQKHTGRERVMVFEGGYHGSLLCGFTRKEVRGAGVKDLATKRVLRAPFDFVVGPYNDLEETRRLATEAGQDLACIVVEPMLGAGGCIPGDPVFLHGLRALATDLGAVLIFDEVQTARLSVGGRQALLNIDPDLTTVGKFFGGGFAFGAFGGKQAIMSMFDSRSPDAVSHGGTFNNSPLTMRAGAAAISHLLTPCALSSLNSLGDVLRQSSNDLFQRLSVPLEMTGLGSINQLKPTSGAPRETLELVYFGLLEKGIAIAQRGLISLTLSITLAQVERFVSGLEEVLVGLGRVLDP